MKKFSDLTEREVLAVAIASEEDGRIYMSFAENLAKRYPESARIFEQMAEEEKGQPRQRHCSCSSARYPLWGPSPARSNPRIRVRQGFASTTVCTPAEASCPSL
jgi:hypothetical protein